MRRRWSGSLVLFVVCLGLTALKLLWLRDLPGSVAWAPLWFPFVVFSIVALVMLRREVAKVKRERREKD